MMERTPLKPGKGLKRSGGLKQTGFKNPGKSLSRKGAGLKRTGFKNSVAGLKRKSQPIKKRKSLNPLSERRKLERKIYSKKRQVFLLKNPICWHCRNARSTDVHHTQKCNGPRLLDKRYWTALCRGCHQHVETHREEAYKNGFLRKVNSRND